MSYKEYLAKRRRDPEYRKVEKRLKPILDLADDVFDLRMERGWTQAELARRVGTRQANISRLENGLANPTLKFLQKLSKVFGVELVVRLRPQFVEEQAESKEEALIVLPAPAIITTQADTGGPIPVPDWPKPEKCLEVSGQATDTWVSQVQR